MEIKKIKKKIIFLVVIFLALFVINLNLVKADTQAYPVSFAAEGGNLGPFVLPSYCLKR